MNKELIAQDPAVQEVIDYARSGFNPRSRSTDNAVLGQLSEELYGSDKYTTIVIDVSFTRLETTEPSQEPTQANAF